MPDPAECERSVSKALRAGVLSDELFIKTKLWIEDAGYDRTIGVSSFHPDRLIDLIVHHGGVPR